MAGRALGTQIVTLGRGLAGVLSSLSALGLAAISTPGACQPETRGEAAFSTRCSLCHQLDAALQGPGLRGVVGRKAATWPDYDYSDGLSRSGLVWTPANLDAFLKDPQKLIPGTAMQIVIADPQERAELIAYLAQQK